MTGGVGGDQARRVRDLLALHRHEQARRLALAGLAERPDDAELVLLLGLAELGLDDLGAAARTARRASALAPHDAEPQRLLAVALTESEDQWREAERPGRAAVRLGPEHAENHAALAWAQLRNGSKVPALASARHAVRLAPSDPEMFVLIAATQHALGDSRAAIANLRRALVLDPANASAINNLAVVGANAPIWRRISALTSAATLDVRLEEPRHNLDVLTLQLLVVLAMASSMLLPVAASTASELGLPFAGPALSLGLALCLIAAWRRLPRAFRRSRRLLAGGHATRWLSVVLVTLTVAGFTVTASTAFLSERSAENVAALLLTTGTLGVLAASIVLAITSRRS